MATTLGRDLATRLGTELEDLLGPPDQTDANLIYALSSMSAANYFSTPGGEAGTAADFGGIYVGRIASVPATAQMLWHKSKGDSPPYSGWELYAGAAGDLVIYLVDGSGTFRVSRARRIVSTDVGKLVAMIWMHDPSGTQRPVLWIDREKYTTANIAATTFSPSVEAQEFGAFLGGYGASSFEPIAWATFRGVLTDANARAALDSIRTSNGIIPTSIAGVTMTHGSSLRVELAASGSAIVNGQVAPTSIRDTVTGASVDAHTRLGAPTVKTIAASTPRLWNYEITPTVRGGSSFADGDFYGNATAGVIPGSTSSFWAAVSFIVWQQSTSANRALLSALNTTGSTGFEIRTINLSQAIGFYMYDNTNAVRLAPLSAAVETYDVGKILYYVAVYDSAAGRMRGYWKRSEVGTGTAVTGYAPSTAGFRLGRGAVASSTGATGVAILGAAYGLGAPSLATVQASFDSVAANDGRPVAIAGMTSNLWDLTQDALDNGGGLGGVALADRVGSVALARTGSTTTYTKYSRAFAW